jgi:hypothetical protein
MRHQTLYTHLSITEDALRYERVRVSHQLAVVRKLKAEGLDVATANELLQSMKNELISLERHRELLLQQLKLFVPSSPPTHLGR